jgi:hypothetical protein
MRSFFLASALVLSGCMGTDSGNPPGPVQCTADSECAAICAGFVEAAAPLAQSVYRITDARCEMIGFAGGASSPGCSCETEGGSLVLAASSPDECLHYGRDRTCLYAQGELPGCSLDDVSSCDAACADLQARLDADAQRALDVEVRRATCDGAYCDCVLRIEDGCYVNADLTRYDCALSDDAILAQHPARML